MNAVGYRKISKKEWQTMGGFSNPRLVRTTKGGGWAYYEDMRC